MHRFEHKKEWIVTKNRDHIPADIFLQLGQILTDYANPYSAVTPAGISPIPEATLEDKPADQEVNYESSEPRQIAFRAWQYPASNPVSSPKIKSKAQKEYEAIFGGHTLSVEMFQPTTDYVETALSRGDAHDHTFMPWYMTRKRLWMVSGRQISGKRIKTSEGVLDQATGRIEENGEGSADKVPTNAGSDNHDQSIYCYRLHEIVVKRKEIMPKAFSRAIV